MSTDARTRDTQHPGDVPPHRGTPVRSVAALTAVVAGLVAGKVVGITGATWLVQRLTRAELSEDLAWSDVLGLSLLAGIGFTVSLLIGELAFGTGSAADDHVKIGVLTASLLAAFLATAVLRYRNRVHRRIHERERVDLDHDDVPDVYEQEDADDGR